MEVKLLNQINPDNFNDGLDSALDTIGIILDNPVMCGACMLEMKQVDQGLYSCPNCNALFRLKR